MSGTGRAGGGVSLRGTEEERGAELAGAAARFRMMAELLRERARSGWDPGPVLWKVLECLPEEEKDGVDALVAFSETAERLRAAREGPGTGHGDIGEYAAFASWAFRLCNSGEDGGAGRNFTGWERLAGIFGWSPGGTAGEKTAEGKSGADGPPQTERCAAPAGRSGNAPAAGGAGGKGHSADASDAAHGPPETAKPAPGRTAALAGAFAPETWRSGRDVEVQWSWPEGAEGALLLWRADRTPGSAEDPSAKRVQTWKRPKERRGWHTVKGAGEATLHFALYALGADGAAGEEGTAFDATGRADRWRIDYSVERRGRAGDDRGGTTVRIRGTGRGMEGLPALAVVAKAGGAPLHAGDGTVVARIPPAGGLAADVDIPAGAAGEEDLHFGVFLDHPDARTAERVDGPRASDRRSTGI